MKTPDTSWKIKGSCFDPNKPDVPKPNRSLTIPEQGTSVTMPGCTDPFGRPIDANLALRYIANFKNSFKILFKKHHADFDEALDSLEPDELKQTIKKTRDLHKKIMKLNYGMTLDKNLAQKLLSQPGCEGLRFYLCSRGNAYDHISLVVVGVDQCGYDLNYKNPKITYCKNAGEVAVVPGTNDTPPVADVPISSLTGEYVTPPYDDNGGVSTDAQTNSDFYDRFVLLNIATGVHPVPAATKTSNKPGNK